MTTGGSERVKPELAPRTELVGTTASIVLINGSSSAGKTTLAKALAAELGSPWRARHMDMVWPNFFASGSRVIAIGRRIRETARPYPRLFYEQNGVVTFLAMAAEAAARGERLILDAALLTEPLARYLCSTLDQMSTLLVAADCPLELLLARQASRRTRPGRVERHYAVVHRSLVYDTLVDTSTASPDVLAADLARWLDSRPAPAGLRLTAAKLLADPPPAPHA